MKNLAKEFGFIIGKRHVGSQPLNKIEESFSNYLLITYPKIGMGFPGTSTFRRICWELRHGDATERFFCSGESPELPPTPSASSWEDQKCHDMLPTKGGTGRSWWDVAQDSTGYIVLEIIRNQ